MFKFLTLGAVGTTIPAIAVETNGAIDNQGATNAYLTQLQTNAAPAAGQINFITSSAASLTLTNIAGTIATFSNAGAITLTLDYAYNIVAAIAGPYQGMSFPVEIATYGAGGSIATPTLSSTNGGVTLAGTTALAATSFRKYRGLITQLTTTSGAPVTSGTTFTSITQVGSTNAFTLALGTNAISPTVGQAIYLSVTGGTTPATTLPSGWYPISFVTSATSFVIMTPPGTVWQTAGATVTVPGTTTAPNVFSPLITQTGLYTCTTTAV